MKAYYFIAAVSGIIMATSATAQTSDDVDAASGFYGQLNVGLTSAKDLRVVFPNDSDDGSVGVDLETKSTMEFGGALGYDFGTVRTEIDVKYSRARNNAISLATINGTKVPAGALEDYLDEEEIETDIIDLEEVKDLKISGNRASYSNGNKLRRLSAMANVWFDIPVGKIAPYVGGGMGIQGSEIAGEGKANFAWQLGAGVAIPVSKSVMLSADYRYRQQGGYSLKDEGEVYAKVGKTKSNSFMIGLRAYF